KYIIFQFKIYHLKQVHLFDKIVIIFLHFQQGYLAFLCVKHLLHLQSSQSTQIPFSFSYPFGHSFKQLFQYNTQSLLQLIHSLPFSHSPHVSWHLLHQLFSQKNPFTHTHVLVPSLKVNPSSQQSHIVSLHLAQFLSQQSMITKSSLIPKYSPQSRFKFVESTMSKVGSLCFTSIQYYFIESKQYKPQTLVPDDQKSNISPLKSYLSTSIVKYSSLQLSIQKYTKPIIIQ
ncbi:hypothetical protein IMG5_082200, partial [Ichthyophthirius multifiliis]